MRRPLSVEFKVVLGVLGLVSLGVGIKLLAEATATGPVIENVSDDVQVTQNVPYGPVGGQGLFLDVYQPRGWTMTPRPAILLIHGGAWMEGDKAGERDLATRLVPEGFVAFAINYRLLFENKFRYPTQILDLRRATRWVRLHAHEYGADPDRVGAVGWSAGGHLAALLGTTDRIDPDDPNSVELSSQVDCVVDTAGPTDFTDAASPPVGPRLIDMIPALFGTSRDECPTLYRDASPVRHVNARSAPTLIVHGSDDETVPVDQAHRFERALRAARVEVKLVEFVGEGHGFTQPRNQQRWFAETVEFLNRHLKP